MNLPKLGHAVIINNIASEMPGSKVDLEALKEAYVTIGFNVQIHSDCTAQVSTSPLYFVDEKNYQIRNRDFMKAKYHEKILKVRLY